MYRHAKTDDGLSSAEEVAAERQRTCSKACWRACPPAAPARRRLAPRRAAATAGGVQAPRPPAARPRPPKLLRAQTPGVSAKHHSARRPLRQSPGLAAARPGATRPRDGRPRRRRSQRSAAWLAACSRPACRPPPARRPRARPCEAPQNVSAMRPTLSELFPFFQIKVHCMAGQDANEQGRWLYHMGALPLVHGYSGALTQCAARHSCPAARLSGPLGRCLVPAQHRHRVAVQPRRHVWRPRRRRRGTRVRTRAGRWTRTVGRMRRRSR